MRRIIVPFALGGLLSASVVACDVEDPFMPGTDTSIGTDTSTGEDTIVPPEDTSVSTQYLAVIVDDTDIFPTHRSDGGNPCATSSVGAHGADIDAVKLFNDADVEIGTLSNARLAAGTECEIAAKYADFNEVLGQPDGTLTENFVSLGGGYVIGEFENAALILPGYSLQVFELGKDVNGVDEGYEVFVATDLSCGQSGTSRDGCQVRIGEGKGNGTFNELSGF
jgi:hypothetical protein